MLQNIDFETLINDIESEKCVLIIGPDIAMNRQQASVYKGLMNYFAAKPQLNVAFDNDGLATFRGKPGPTKRTFYSHLKSYFEAEQVITPLHQKLAQMYFHLMLSLSPDTEMEKAFQEYSFPLDFKYYNKTVNPDKIERLPNKHRPLLYNLFGVYHDEDSLIASQDDIIEFLFSILGSFRVPLGLMNVVKSAKVFIFLGCHFNKWYLKLILKLLELDRDAVTYANESDERFDELAKTFYINNYQMEFLNVDSAQFIELLYAELKLRGKLKKLPDQAENPLKAKIRDLLAKDEMQDALDVLLDHFEANLPDDSNSIVLMSGRYNGLKRKIDKKTIAAEQAEIEMNQIRDGLLNLCELIK